VGILEISFQQPVFAGPNCGGIIDSVFRVTYTAAPADWQCASDLPGKCRPIVGWTSITGTQPNSTDDFPAPQMANITITFDSTVWVVFVKMHGAVKCPTPSFPAELPVVTARNGVDSIIGIDTVTLYPPEDCGSDEIGGNALDSLPKDTVQVFADTFFFRGAIRKLEITGVNPWQWQVEGLDAYAKLFWNVAFNELPPGDTCLTGDRLLDTKVMRAFLRRLRDSSNWNDTVKINRRERGGHMYRLPSGDLMLKTAFTANDEWCASQNPTGLIPPGGRMLATVHTHPFSPNDTLPLTACSYPNPPFGQPMAGHPSPEDLRRLRQDSAFVGYPIRGYVMDKDSIYVIPPGTTAANMVTRVIAYPQTDPATSCSRL
jgi:hypothetical protein